MEKVPPQLTQNSLEYAFDGSVQLDVVARNLSITRAVLLPLEIQICGILPTLKLRLVLNKVLCFLLFFVYCGRCS